MNDTVMSQSVLRDLVLRLHELQQQGQRIRVESQRWGSPFTYTGYPQIPGHLVKVAQNNEQLDPTTFINLRFRKNQWGGFDGWEYVKLQDFHAITTTAKHRRTGEYGKLWSPVPFAMTEEGELDMARSLKDLLGIA